MREEFEAAYVAWLVSSGWGRDSALRTLEKGGGADEYRSPVAKGAWWGWQASRAALVVDLARVEMGWVDHQEVIEAIEAAGVRVKP